MKQYLCIYKNQTKLSKAIAESWLSGLRMVILIVLLIGQGIAMASNTIINGRVTDVTENVGVPNHEVWYFDVASYDTLSVKTNSDGFFTIKLNIEKYDSSLYLFTIDPCFDRYVYQNVNPWSDAEISIDVCGAQEEEPCEALFTYQTDSINLSQEDIKKVRFFDWSKGEVVRWDWTFGDGTSSNKQNPVHQYDKEGVYNVTLTITCKDCSSTFTDYVWIYIPEPPSPCDVDMVYINTFDKNNQVVYNEFQFYSTAGDAIKEYFWDFGDNETSTEAKPIHKYEKDGEYKVSLTVKSSDCERTISLPLYVFPWDSIDDKNTCEAEFGYEFSNYALGQSSEVQFYNHTYGEHSYKWDFGDGSTSTEKSPLHTYIENGNYQVTLSIFSEDCESMISRNVSISNIDSTSEACKANFEFYSDSTASGTVSGSTIYFYNTSQGYYDSYNWNFGDDAIASGKDVSHSYVEAGTYKVTLTVSRGACEHSLSREIVIASPGDDVDGKSVRTSIMDFATINELKMYPNPAIEQLTISFDSKLGGIVNLEIFNMQGCKCFSKSKTSFLGVNSIPVDVSALKPGKYVLRIQNEKEIQTQIIIKQ